MKNPKELFKILTIILLVLTTIGLSGCKNNSKISTKDSISNIGKNETIQISVDKFLKEDIDSRLKDIKKENVIPIEIGTNTAGEDIVITSDTTKIPTNWQKKIIYDYSSKVSPESFKANNGSKITSDYVIYFASKDNKSESILNFLVESYKKTGIEPITLTFTGDMMLSRTVESFSKKAGNWNWPFINIANLTKNSDLTIGNLESPFSDPPKPFAHNTAFGADKKMVSGLNYSGFDIVSLANNHFGDSGKQGMNLTFQTLSENKIDYFGANSTYNTSHKYVIKEIGGIKVAFLGYVTPSVTPSAYASSDSKPGLNLINITQMKLDVKEAKKNADFVIVSMHAGTEYTPDPNDEQIEFAHSAINAGADMVYGHHPHVVQATEIYNFKPIFYSLGNFVFDQEWSEETKEGLVVKLSLISNKIVGAELTPILIKNYGQPEKANANIGQNILERIYQASAKLD